MTRVALIHATPLAIAPIADSMRTLWPEADTINLLDDSLSRDVQSSQPAAIDARFLALARYAHGAGAQAVLYTCSAFGPSIDTARRAIALPMLKPNEAMFDEALACGSRIALLATFEPALSPMAAELCDAAAAQGRPIALTARFVPGAFEAMGAGRAEEHDDLVAEAAADLGDQDVLMLAQFSMARAAERTRGRVTMPVLSSPDSAVRRLRSMLG